MAEHQGHSPDLNTREVDDTFHAKDAIGEGIRSSLYTGGAGLFISAVQNSVAKENIGTFGIISRTGSSVALFATMGGTYAFVSSASANLRASDDHWNQFAGGFAAGSIAGLRRRTFPAFFGNGLALGIVLGVAAYTGSAMFGTPNMHPDEGRWPTKEELRKRFARPANETINELGEGRGIYGAGYEERRRQRLKDNYGLDVPKPFWEEQTPPAPMR